MDVIFDATDMDIRDPEISSCARDVRMEVRARCGIQERVPAPRCENDVDINYRVCMHGSLAAVCRGRLRGRNL